MRRGAPIGIVIVIVALGASACGSTGDRRDAGPTPGDDAGTPPDAAAPDAGGSGEDANIDVVLACLDPGGVRGAPVAGELQLHELDLAAFPDALCNDGTGAVLHFRPYRGDANRDRWVISLRGGGACGSADACAARWCGCGNAGSPPCEHTDYASIFNANNMSGGGPRAQEGEGVQRRDGPPNPFADFNHVQLVYCSSDSWAGNARGVTYTVTHPRRGTEVTYTMHFLGSQILAADLATLRQDGVPALEYTASGAAVPMPDLDEAEQVVMVGDSGGGAGVINNLDRIAALLRADHVGSVEPDIVGVIDAIVGPEQSRLDWSGTPAVTYADAMAATYASPANANGAFDESCVDWHETNRPGSEGECADVQHIVRHHITTPYFVRMALLDGLISDFYLRSGLADPDLGPFVLGGPMMNVPLVFAQVLQRELAAFGTLPSRAEEGESMSVAPGAFGPACPRHDTIHTDAEVYGTSVDPDGAAPAVDDLFFFDVFANWLAGREHGVVVTTDPMRADTTCGL